MSSNQGYIIEGHLEGQKMEEEELRRVIREEIAMFMHKGPGWWVNTIRLSITTVRDVRSFCPWERGVRAVRSAIPPS